VTAYQRWRPALIAVAVLLTVLAIASARTTPPPTGSTEIDPFAVTTVPVVEKVPLRRELFQGVVGDDVKMVQQRLATLKFDPGPQDGVYGQNTIQAVWAFEKLVMGKMRTDATGVVTPEMWDLMQGPVNIVPRRQPGTPAHVEVYLPEQVMAVFNGAVVAMVTHISSGSTEQWCEEVTIDPGEDGNDSDEQIKRGYCGEAITPAGVYYFYNRKVGMRESKLGSMYNPVYFNFGIAVHGAINVPLEPESHGCIRIPMTVARYFPALVQYGDKVYVFDGLRDPEVYGSPPPTFDWIDPNYVPSDDGEGSTSTTVAGATTTTVLETGADASQP
jgi:hypothetical protein